MSHAGKALIDPDIVFEKIALAPGMRVADLGCGRTGHLVFTASRVVGDTGIVYAVDILKDVLENIRSRVRTEGYDNVQTVWSDVEMVGSTPIPEKSLDSCFFMNALFLVGDKARALEEARRLLKDGGSLVIIDWAKKLGPLGPSEEQQLRKEEAQSIAESVGFSTKDDFMAGGYHYCLIFKK